MSDSKIVKVGENKIAGCGVGETVKVSLIDDYLPETVVITDITAFGIEGLSDISNGQLTFYPLTSIVKIVKLKKNNN